jgi:hypothetical protein
VILKTLRLVHLYLGLFTAPALLFFAFTGAIQTFSLHETTRGSSYKPPQWAVVLGQIHKKQTPVITKKPLPTVEASSKSEAPVKTKAEAEPMREATAAATTPVASQHHPLPLKIFFLIASISLTLSTLTGIYMSYKYARNRLVINSLLVSGLIIPIVLVFV